MFNLKLDEDFVATGTDLNEFLSALDVMDMSTTVEPIVSTDVTLFSFVEKTQNGMLNFLEIPSEKNLLIKALKGQTSMAFKLIKTDKIIERGGELLIDELVKGDVGMMFKIDSHFYFLSRNILMTLLQRVGMGDSILTKSPERDLHLAKIFGEEIPLVVVKRNVNGIRKIFSVMTEQYKRIKQSTIGETVNLLRFEQPMGEAVVREWTITNAYTEIYIDFPNSELVVDNLIPGVLFKTSDIGCCSTKAVGYWRAGKHYAFMNEGHAQSHRGSTDVGLCDFFYKDILKEYEEYHQKLIDLKCQTLGKDFDSVIKSTFKALDFTKEIGKMNEQKTKTQMKNLEEWTPSVTLFDIFLKLFAVNTETFKDTKKIAFEYLIGQVPFLTKSAMDRIVKKVA